jgi:hypothetical protein
MPFTVPEALADLAPALALVQQIQALVAALPPAADRKMKDYSDIIVAVIPNVAALVDEIEAQAKS